MCLYGGCENSDLSRLLTMRSLTGHQGHRCRFKARVTDMAGLRLISKHNVIAPSAFATGVRSGVLVSLSDQPPCIILLSYVTDSEEFASITRASCRTNAGDKEPPEFSTLTR